MHMVTIPTHVFPPQYNIKNYIIHTKAPIRSKISAKVDEEFCHVPYLKPDKLTYN